MISVLKCESNFIHYKENGEVLRGNVTPADTGVGQVNLDYHEEEAERLGYDLEDLYGNLAYSRMLYDKEGITPWVCKKHVALVH